MDKAELDAIREKYRDFRGPWMNVNPAHIRALLEYIEELEARVEYLEIGDGS